MRGTRVLERGTLVAVASTRPARAVRGGVRAGRPQCSYDELVAADDIDAVVVAARSIDHARVAIACAREGKHVLLEKPGATTLADHDLLVAEAAARSPTQVVQVGYHRRYDATFVEAHRLVVERRGRHAATRARDEPRRAGRRSPRIRALPAGSCVDMASHDYDAACWLLGQEPVEAFAARQSAVYPELETLGDLDNAVVTIRFAGGGIATTHVSRTCAFGHDIRCEVVGSDGSVLIGNAASRDGVVVSDGERPGARFRRTTATGSPTRTAPSWRRSSRPARVTRIAGPGLVDDRRAVAIGIAARASAVAGALAVGDRLALALVGYPATFDRK